jgi:Flp pilus assembly protein TadG
MLRPNSRRRERQSGVAIIILSLMLCSVLLPMIGLAFDLTILYVVKAKLAGAVDAGVLAGGRSLIGSKTLAAQQAQITQIAIDLLNANMPQGYWGTLATPTVETPTASIVTQDNASKRILITLQASVQVPLVFLRYFQSTAIVRSSAVAARRYLRMVIVLDRSSSMSGTPITELKAAVSNTDPLNLGFVQDFFEGQDDLGLVVFGGSGIVAYPPRDPTIVGGGGNGPDPNFQTIANPNIPTLVSLLGAGSNTGTAEGLILAYKELQKSPQPLYYNVIVLFTDGQPNGFTAGWNGATPPALYNADANHPVGDTLSTPTNLSSIKTTSACTYEKYTDFTAGHQMVGWVSQGGGYANLPYQPGIGSAELHGVFGNMQNTKYTGTYVSPGADVKSWVANAGQDSSIDGTNVNSCPFRLLGTTPGNADSDVTVFPAGDIYGNGLLTADYQTSYNYHHNGNAGLHSDDIANPYQIGLVSWNAAYLAAKRIRGDSYLKPTIYCIGYSGGDAIDRGFLKRLTNTNQGFTDNSWALPLGDPYGPYPSSAYDPTSTSGMYYDAGPGSMAAAFQKVRSAILSLAM